jgi:hypothetical protein
MIGTNTGTVAGIGTMTAVAITVAAVGTAMTTGAATVMDGVAGKSG